VNIGQIRITWPRVVGLIVGIVLGYWVFHTVYVWTLCSWYGHETGRETSYSMFLGCMVKINDKYVPRSELRVVQ